MISFERTRNYWLINQITKENSKYLENDIDFKNWVNLDQLWFILVRVNNVVKGYYLISDMGEGVFDCHLCVRRISPTLNLLAAELILQWFIDYKGATKFTTQTTPRNKKAKEFALKLGFRSIDDCNFDLRIK